MWKPGRNTPDIFTDKNKFALSYALRKVYKLNKLSGKIFQIDKSITGVFLPVEL